MSEFDSPKSDADKGKSASSSNKLLLIIALGNFLGVFALGGYLAYDKLVASPAAAQSSKKGSEHGAEKKAGAHGTEAKPDGEHHGDEKAEGDHGREKKTASHGPDVDESINPPDGPGPILALEPIVTNLADHENDRYLKLGLQLRVTSEAAKSEVEASLVPIRSAILMYLSSLTVADITGADKRRIVQSQLRRIANEAMPVSRIRFVYFTEFVVQ